MTTGAPPFGISRMFSLRRFFSFGPCTARFLFLAQPKRENGGKAAQRRLWRMQQAAFEDAARLAAPAGAGNRPAATVLQ